MRISIGNDHAGIKLNRLLNFIWKKMVMKLKITALI